MGTYFTDVVQPLGPIAHWRLGEQSGSVANDETSENNDGTYSGPTLNAVAGPHTNGPSAPAFDGSNDYVNIYSSGLEADFTPAAFTISAWLKADDWLASGERVVVFIKSDDNNFAQIAKSNTAEKALLVVKAGGVLRSYEPSISSGMQSGWIHFALTYNAATTTWAAYADGSFVGQHTDLGVWSPTTLDSDECTIGRGYGGNYYFDGAIADVSIFDTVLNGTQIATLANAYTESGSSGGGTQGDTTILGALEIIGQENVAQLTVRGHTTQTNPLQIWQNSAADRLAVMTSNGRLQVGSFDTAGAMATDDSLIEAHRGDTSTLPKRGLHLLGRISGALSDAVNWVVQELELLGSGGVSGIHTALRTRLTFGNSGVSDTVELRAGDFQVTNQTGSSGTPVGQATALRAVVRNESGAYLDKSIGLEVKFEGTNLGEVYALHADKGTAHFAEDLELPIFASAPTANPPANFVKVYTKLESSEPQLYAKDSAGVEHSLGGSSGVTAPAGTIWMYGGASAPSGWLLCDGAAVSRTTYAALFSALSTTYGAGDGSTTFNVPDLRGRAPIGAGQGTSLTNRVLGASVGTETHTLTTNEMPAHVHSGGVTGSGSGIATGSGRAFNPTASAGGGAAHNNMQPSLAISFIVKT